MRPFTDKLGFQQLGWALHAAGFVLTILMLLGVHVYVFGSLRRESSRLDSQISTAADYYDQESMITARHTTLQSTLIDRQNRLEDLLTRIPESPRESEFLAQLTQLARSSGMTISRYTPGQSREETTHADLEVSLSARASYESICRFFDGLADLQRLCHVTRLKIVAPEPGQLTYPVDMTLRIFFTPSVSEDGGAAQHG